MGRSCEKLLGRFVRENIVNDVQVGIFEQASSRVSEENKILVTFKSCDELEPQIALTIKAPNHI